MKIKNRQNLLRTAGLLGVGTVLAVAPSFADSRNDRRENRDARRDVQEARRDVRESQRDLRDNRQDLREAQRDLQRERRDDRWNNHNTRPVPLPRPLPQPNWNQNWNNQANVTLEGTVISDFRGNGFTMRSNDGRQFFVQVQGGEAYGVSRGDVVRVFGPVIGNRFNARSMRILVNR